MRLIGWCVKCHKVKQVRVTVPMPGAVQTGVCFECEEENR